MSHSIDIYCERISPVFWAEPLNAISNLAFFIAAFFAWRLARREQKLDVPGWILIGLLLCIGTGSTLFHTFATGWASLADTVPIFLFQLAFLMIYARKVMGLSAESCLLLGEGFLGVTAWVWMIPASVANGSMLYLPALVFVTWLGVWHWRAGKAARVALLAAAGVFSVSLTFRSIDMAVCPALPVGVHYLWHMLNAAVLYLCLQGYLLNSGTRPKA